MGNNIKSRLHIHSKKDDRPTRAEDGNAMSESTNPGRNKVDQTIMTGPNRARAAETNASDIANTSTSRDADTPPPVTTSRART
jgi:hypothetical protein